MFRLLMYNEEKLAIRLYASGFTSGFRVYEAVLIAKYLRHVLGYGDAKIKTNLISFCKEHDIFFNYISRRHTIKEVLKKSKTGFIDKSIPVLISQHDIQEINSLNLYKDRKMFFCLLVLFRLNNGFIGLYRWKDIRLLLKSKITNSIISNYMMKFSEMEWLKSSGNGHVLTKVFPESLPLFEINEKNIYDLNNIFKELFGVETFTCAGCSLIFERHSSNQKRCSTCSKKERKHQIKRNVNKFRERLSLE